MGEIGSGSSPTTARAVSILSLQFATTVSANFTSSVTPVCVAHQCNAAHSRALSQYRRAVYPRYRNH